MSLLPYVQALARGPGRSRHLTREEAADALGQIMAGTAVPEAAGAVLMLLRYRGENADEIAGFVDALRDEAGDWPQPALDWPSYAAGRTRGLPWFLLAARLVARAGYPVMLHGWNSHQAEAASVTAALDGLQIPSAADPDTAAAALEAGGIVYLPLGEVCPAALRVLRLREVLGLRSPINTALRLFNPGKAAASVQGVFHPPYLKLQEDSGLALGQPALTVIKGGGGEFERTPTKAMALFGLRDGQPMDMTAPALMPDVTGRLAEGPALVEPRDLAALWSGEAEDAFASAIVTGTAALALFTLGAAPNVEAAQSLAESLWAARNA